MWVVFLAVIGAALSTVAVIVNEISTPTTFSTQDPKEDPKELRERLLVLVQNQFFMIFAPLGGIFIYQALILGGAAAQTFVVAIAALGAGATLNILLKLALSKASEALMTDSQKQKKAEEDAQKKAQEQSQKKAQEQSQKNAQEEQHKTLEETLRKVVEEAVNKSQEDARKGKIIPA
jgi:hypothetical protein